MGCDICYTNHAEADQDDMDALLTLLGVAGCNYIMGVPGADDVMLNYQSTCFTTRSICADVWPAARARIRSVAGGNPALPKLAGGGPMAIDLTALTPARVGLRRAGHSLPDRPSCSASNSTTRAPATLSTKPSTRRRWALPHMLVCSRAHDRVTYLRRPDLGRRLAPEPRARRLSAATTMRPL